MREVVVVEQSRAPSDSAVDCALERSVLKVLTECEDLEILDLGVVVRHRVAVIEGWVPSVLQCRRAEKLVRDEVRGLMDVINKFKPAHTTGAHAPGPSDDPRPATLAPEGRSLYESRILAYLSENLSIDSGLVVRYRGGGEVDLLGEVPSELLKERAGTETRWLPFVTSVENYLKVTDWSG